MNRTPVPSAVFHLAAGAALACAVIPAHAGAAETAARRAWDFVHSVGVAAHYNCTGPVSNRDIQIRQYLLDARIWNIRTDWRSAGPGTAVIKYLGDAGIRFAFTIKAANATDVRNPAAGVARQLGEIKSNDCVKYARYITGTNEPDIASEYQSSVGAAWPTYVKHWQDEVWNQVNGDAAFNGIPVVGPNQGNLWSADKRTLWKTVSGWDTPCDLADFHPYWNGRPMEAQMNTWFGQLGEIWPAKAAAMQVIATEMGYHYASGVDGFISEAGGAVYYLRAWLEMFRLGVPASYMYMLENLLVPDPNNREHNWGMFRYDGTPRPVYTALKNLNTIIDDPDGESITPGTLDCSFSAQPADLSRLLLMKSDGTFILALRRRVAPLRVCRCRPALTGFSRLRAGWPPRRRPMPRCWWRRRPGSREAASPALTGSGRATGIATGR